MPKRLLLLLVCAAALLAAPAASAQNSAKKPANPAKRALRSDRWPLHTGPTAHYSSRGPRVAELQYLLRDPRPKQNVFGEVKGTFHQKLSGIFGHSTAEAVVAYKYRLGYPARGQCGARSSWWRSAKVGPYMFALMRGRRQRPACWVAVAAKRIAAIAAGATPAALKLKNIELSQVGVYEPLAFYRYNGYFHLPWEAWCAIFQGWSEAHVGLRGTLNAPNPWYVPTLIDWGRANGWLFATAKVGEFVLYFGDISHVGYVIRVDPNGYYWTVEGNYASHVAEVQHSPYDHLHYFLAIPGIA